MKLYLSLALAFLFGLGGINAQSLKHKQGELIVKLKPSVSIDKFLQTQNQSKDLTHSCNLKQAVIPRENMWLISFDFSEVDEKELLDEIFKSIEVEYAQFNRLVSLRAEPNDPRFSSQWQYINNGGVGSTADADLDADLAWDITTGGLTPQGDTIVVAVIDDGIDIDHEDIAENLWRNHTEIPDNGIDDDGNGYVDDYLGFNSNHSNDNDLDDINGGNHGTPVAGIVGAKGNNAIGVAGVNWDVKLMIIKNNFNTDEANVLKAYGYALTQRRIYNETNGAQGAFVVSTNASWGLDFGDPDDSQLWCGFYDVLGEEGILSCGATINNNVDVDREGDLPTGCGSDYMISVTNMDDTGNKVNGAGYGLETIDLGAFGAGTFTTTRNDNYGGFGGTSGATPHVAGTIALLYAAPCPNLGNIAKLNPSEAALFARKYILDGVKPNTSLQGITVTGGVLNMFNSLSLLMDECDDCSMPSGISVDDLTDTAAQLKWVAFNSALAVNLQWRKQGESIWNTVFNIVPPYQFSGLEACTMYEVEIEAICDAETSGYSDTFIFETDGCCKAPDTEIEASATEETITITWKSVLAADAYHVRLREKGENDWSSPVNTATNSQAFDGLIACTDYEYQIQTICAGIQTDWSLINEIQTAGCGACLDNTYCQTFGDDSSQEWIESISINGIKNQSGDNSGYAEFTDLGISLSQGGLYELILEPGFNQGQFPEYFKVWIDANQDGSFEEDELIYDPGTATEEALVTNFVIPPDALLGLTRMRVVMKWTGFSGGDSPPEPCEAPFDFGETEDYCLTIIEPGEGCAALASDLDTASVSLSTAIITWDAVDNAELFQYRYKETLVQEWFSDFVEDPELVLFDLKKCTEYEIQVQTFCNNQGTEFTDSFVFRTRCNVGTNDVLKAEDFLSVYPNPFSDELIMTDLKFDEDLEGIKLFDVNGKDVVTEGKFGALNLGTSIYLSNLNSLVAGVYFLQLNTKSDVYLIRLVKQ